MLRSVLVVDDDAEFRDLATRIMTSWGHAVIGEAGSVAEALAQATILRPDVVLVDIPLPDGADSFLPKTELSSVALRQLIEGR